MNAQTTVLMILCEGCDINMVENFATKNGFNLKCIFSKQNLLEKNFIYQIELEK